MPRPLPVPQVAKVSPGGSHTAFLTTDGEVWTCGRGEYGLCGNGGTEDQLLPAPLEAFEEHIIVDVQVSGCVCVLVNTGRDCGAVIVQ